MALLVLFLIGMALAIVPLLGVIPGVSPAARLLMSMFGAVILLLASIVAVITVVYHRASANVALVRTGMGGEKVVIGGGALVVPFVHNVVPVSLESARVNVERRGAEAVVTMDDAPVEVAAEFFVKVRPDPEDILLAARSLAAAPPRSGAASDLVREKLVSAVRNVVATKESAELRGGREAFTAALRRVAMEYLAGNGLMLELMNVTALDVTDADPPQAAGYMSGVVAR
jgi:uncharacterized membrane protein YqiK